LSIDIDEKKIDLQLWNYYCRSWCHKGNKKELCC